jgi:hypothetical protein
LNAVLASAIPGHLARSGLEIALDWHDEPLDSIGNKRKRVCSDEKASAW